MLPKTSRLMFLLLHLLLFLSVIVSDPEVDNETSFAYTEESGKGPKDWGKVDPHWRICGEGKYQSPIDLLDQRVQVSANLGKLKRGYKPAPAVLKNRGHDLAVFRERDAGKININGTDYKLIRVIGIPLPSTR